AAGGGEAHRDPAPVRRLLYRLPRSATDRTQARRTGGAAGLWFGLGLRRPQRSRAVAPGSVAGGAGGEVGSGPASTGWQEHLEPTGTNPGYGQRPGTLQENRAGPWGGGPPAGRSVSAGAPASAGADHSGSGCDR